MAKKRISIKQASLQKEEKISVFSFLKTRQAKSLFSIFLMLFAVFLCIAFISFFFNWQEDQSTLNHLTDRAVKSKNLLGKIGANLSHFFIYDGFGLASFIICFQVFLTGFYLLIQKKFSKIIISWNWGLISMLWVSLIFGFLNKKHALLAGVVGFEINSYLQTFIGKIGLTIVLIFSLFAYLIIRYKVSLDTFIEKIKQERLARKAANIEAKKTDSVLEVTELNEMLPETISTPNKKEKSEFELSVENLKPTISKHSDVSSNKQEISLKIEKEPEPELKVEEVKEENISETKTENQIEIKVKEDELIDDIGLEVISNKNEDSLSKSEIEKKLKELGDFDPTLELSKFKFPTFNLLKQYNETISIDPEELEANKNRIVETLKNYKIGIAEIKATVGPTITLYEIVPEAGIRISKIKNLEDDIALSLSALGIRIIAPIPGKGTIGIEVPNKKSTIVSMHSVISSKKFQESSMELPIALGKTISNETFVVDLAKMPHLLMAGATGQGKSVGLNAVLTSLLYKKHPAEVKFILVDPKKVELTLFNKIERHYLAKLPDIEEAIITDTTKVVHTLNSLCIEMDTRYDLLKAAMVRNIKEYNIKFKKRKLNPNDGHRFLPYIVLVIDEFADLIMTAGKEVETPIARLAQLARAIGIHLIVATQRPSVNVITGIIKANFPARIAFRVTSKIDSRTILD
ncbi:MAG: DNA translocase FtsK, partial [Polaribacter sp.]|nr:DNA translocase FtsK [Polaribacter sp.]